MKLACIRRFSVFPKDFKFSTTLDSSLFSCTNFATLKSPQTRPFSHTRPAFRDSHLANSRFYTGPQCPKMHLFELSNPTESHPGRTLTTTISAQNAPKSCPKTPFYAQKKRPYSAENRHFTWKCSMNHTVYGQNSPQKMHTFDPSKTAQERYPRTVTDRNAPKYRTAKYALTHHWDHLSLIQSETTI